jgi:hypothetical protein
MEEDARVVSENRGLFQQALKELIEEEKMKKQKELLKRCAQEINENPYDWEDSWMDASLKEFQKE